MAANDLHWMFIKKSFNFQPSFLSPPSYIDEQELIGDNFCPDHQIWSSGAVSRDNSIGAKRIISHNFSHTGDSPHLEARITQLRQPHTAKRSLILHFRHL